MPPLDDLLGVPALPEDRDALRELYGAGRETPTGRPYVAVNMVVSLDGSTVVGGSSRALSSAADRRLFGTLRSLADVVLVGAGTVRAEDYGPARADPTAQDLRRGRGQGPAPVVAVVTKSLELDWSARLFSDPDRRPLLVAPADADPARLDAARQVADVVLAGEGAVDVTVALRALAGQGVRSVLAEGGAVLNGHLLEADVVDEMCLTIAPVVVSGGGARAVRGRELGGPAAMDLLSARTADGSLFLRCARVCAVRDSNPEPAG